MQPAYIVRPILPAAFAQPVRPAGQSYIDYTNPYANALDMGLNQIGSTQTVTGITEDPTSMSGVTSPTDNTALYDAVAGGLNTAGTTIASIIASNDRVQIAGLASAAQLQIAALNQQANAARNAGNMTLASQAAQRADQMQMFYAQLQAKNAQTNTPMYLLAGLAALGIVGAVIYFANKPKSARANPRRRSR